MPTGKPNSNSNISQHFMALNVVAVNWN